VLQIPPAALSLRFSPSALPIAARCWPSWKQLHQVRNPSNRLTLLRQNNPSNPFGFILWVRSCNPFGFIVWVRSCNPFGSLCGTAHAIALVSLCGYALAIPLVSLRGDTLLQSLWFHCVGTLLQCAPSEVPFFLSSYFLSPGRAF